jgi:hypothetical protein
MNRERAEELIMQSNPDALFADGFDDAILGIAERCGEYLVAYDINKCITNLIGQGMTHDEAVDYFEFNVAGAYVGEGTPIFVDTDE